MQDWIAVWDKILPISSQNMKMKEFVKMKLLSVKYKFRQIIDIIEGGHFSARNIMVKH